MSMSPAAPAKGVLLDVAVDSEVVAGVQTGKVVAATGVQTGEVVADEGQFFIPCGPAYFLFSVVNAEGTEESALFGRQLTGRLNTRIASALLDMLYLTRSGDKRVGAEPFAPLRGAGLSRKAVSRAFAEGRVLIDGVPVFDDQVSARALLSHKRSCKPVYILLKMAPEAVPTGAATGRASITSAVAYLRSHALSAVLNRPPRVRV